MTVILLPCQLILEQDIFQIHWQGLYCIVVVSRLSTGHLWPVLYQPCDVLSHVVFTFWLTATGGSHRSCVFSIIPVWWLSSGHWVSRLTASTDQPCLWVDLYHGKPITFYWLKHRSKLVMSFIPASKNLCQWNAVWMTYKVHKIYACACQFYFSTLTMTVDGRPAYLPSFQLRSSFQPSHHACHTFFLLTTCSTGLPSFILIEYEDVIFHVFWECNMVAQCRHGACLEAKGEHSLVFCRSRNSPLCLQSTEPTLSQQWITFLASTARRNSSLTKCVLSVCMKDLDSTAGNTDNANPAALEPPEKNFPPGPARNITRPLSSWKFVRSQRFSLWYKSTLM